MSRLISVRKRILTILVKCMNFSNILCMALDAIPQEDTIIAECDVVFLTIPVLTDSTLYQCYLDHELLLNSIQSDYIFYYFLSWEIRVTFFTEDYLTSPNFRNLFTFKNELFHSFVELESYYNGLLSGLELDMSPAWSSWFCFLSVGITTIEF